MNKIPPMFKVLFVPIHPTSCRSMLELADSLKCQSIESHFLLSTSFLKNQSQEITFHGHVIKLTKHFYDKNKNRRWESYFSYFANIFNFLNRLLIDVKAWNLKRWPKKEQLLLKNLEKENYSSVVLFGDRHLGIEPLILSWAKEKNINIVLPPLMIRDNGYGALSIRKNSKFNVSQSIKFQKKFPNQVIQDPNSQKYYSFFDPTVTEIYAKAGLLPTNPWRIGLSGKAIVCVDGEVEKQQLLNNGVEAKRIVITGQAVHDLLWQIKTNVKDKNSDQMKNILLALPQYGEQRTLSWEQHWEETKFLFETLKSFSNMAKVKVSLHPKMVHKKYQELISEYDFELLQGPLYSQLPSSDLFLAINSSTQLWALLCGVPSILMNFFKLDDFIFRQFEGITIIEDKKDLKSSIDKILSNKEYYHQLKLAQESHIRDVSPFDGHCLDRIHKVLTNHLHLEHL